MIVDFTKIDYIDSTGIGELVGYLGKFISQNRKLILVNPSERIQKLLKLAKLDAVFKIYGTEDEAVAAEAAPGASLEGRAQRAESRRAALPRCFVFCPLRSAVCPLYCGRMSVRLTRVFRGSEVESVHRGSIAVVDARGKLIAFAGDPATRSCLRSAAKPFQAIPLLEYGGIEEYDLTPEEIALTCASHGGEPLHVATAAAMLRKGEFDEEDLLCGAHLPYDEKAAADLRASGEPPSPLHNNCSGKHAGMLLATRVMDAPSARYTDAGIRCGVMLSRSPISPASPRKSPPSASTAAECRPTFSRCIGRRTRTRGSGPAPSSDTPRAPRSS